MNTFSFVNSSLLIFPFYCTDSYFAGNGYQFKYKYQDITKTSYLRGSRHWLSTTGDSFFTDAVMGNKPRIFQLGRLKDKVLRMHTQDTESEWLGRKHSVGSEA